MDSVYEFVGLVVVFNLGYVAIDKILGKKPDWRSNLFVAIIAAEMIMLFECL